MGQSHSEQRASSSLSREQLSHELAIKFAKRCFTPIELYSFNDVFRSLADVQSGLLYWREDTLCRFLEIPDALGVGPVLYQSATYLGAFPFPTLAPSILSYEALLKVVVIMTERYGRVLKKGKADRVRLIFRSLAVFDKKSNQPAEAFEREYQSAGSKPEKEEDGVATEKDTSRGNTAIEGFAVDKPQNDEEEGEDDDELALAALESLDAIDVFRHGERSSIHEAQIPTDNFRRLLMLLLVIAPLEAQESLSMHVGMFKNEHLEHLQKTADNLLWAFAVEKHPGILYHDFNNVIANSMPYILDGLNPLFEHFLFSKNVDFSNIKPHDNPSTASSTHLPKPLIEPLLPREGDILTLSALSQLSFFLKGSEIFRRLRPLYFGGDSGFSLGSFDTKVFRWQAPTILLISGTRLPSSASGGREKTFVESLPSSRFPHGGNGSRATGADEDTRVVFGAYVTTPWKHTSKECFGDSSTLLFQLEPIHEVFHASTVNTNYVCFSKSPSSNSPGGISFGCPPPPQRPTSSGIRSLGPVSLALDDSLEFAVFTHDVSGGGSFHAATPSTSTRCFSWQERFAIDALEVWGCGGAEEAKRQREALAFEEREALLRRQVNLGKDIEADRALLEMAGLIGAGNRSGGSV